MQPEPFISPDGLRESQRIMRDKHKKDAAVVNSIGIKQAAQDYTFFARLHRDHVSDQFFAVVRELIDPEQLAQFEAWWRMLPPPQKVVLAWLGAGYTEGEALDKASFCSYKDKGAVEMAWRELCQQPAFDFCRSTLAGVDSNTRVLGRDQRRQLLSHIAILSVEIGDRNAAIRAVETLDKIDTAGKAQHIVNHNINHSKPTAEETRELIQKMRDM